MSQLKKKLQLLLTEKDIFNNLDESKKCCFCHNNSNNRLIEASKNSITQDFFLFLLLRKITYDDI